MTQLTEKVIVIVGLGLIGGSVARGLREKNPSQKILAVDADKRQIDLALQEGVIDAGGELQQMCGQADLIILALPTLTLVECLPQIITSMQAHAVITDVASVKAPVVDAINAITDNNCPFFVPGHPI